MQAAGVERKDADLGLDAPGDVQDHHVFGLQTVREREPGMEACERPGQHSLGGLSFESFR